MVFLKNALMCIYIKVKLINQDCLPILMLLYIMLYIMIAYLMLLYLMQFVCVMLLFFFFSADAFCFNALSWSIVT